MNRSFPVALAAALLAVVPAGAEYPLPPDGPAIDVTRPPFGARGDGETDDTEALQQAITASSAGKRLVYLPDGVYLVSRPLVTAKKRTILHGQSREKTIIKLKDRCPGFGDPDSPQVVLQAGHAGSNDFFNSVHNLTVDVGQGNPGAIALRYHTSNQGAVTNVLLRSSDPGRVGAVGLDLTAPAPGPGLVKNVRIEGFDVGIECLHMPGFCMTFEHIALHDQRKAGIRVERLPITIRGLTSVNSVPVLRLESPLADDAVRQPAEGYSSGWGFASLVDAQLEGGSPDVPAIENVRDCGLFVRNVKASVPIEARRLGPQAA